MLLIHVSKFILECIRFSVYISFWIKVKLLECFDQNVFSHIVTENLKESWRTPGTGGI